jgi:hypothetical protein
VDPRAGLDDVENRKLLTLTGLELRPLGRPARSRSLPTVLSRLYIVKRVNVKFHENPFRGSRLVSC